MSRKSITIEYSLDEHKSTLTNQQRYVRTIHVERFKQYFEHSV